MLNVVLTSNNFRSAQDIHAALRASGETVGLYDLHRHLALLTDEGKLDALQTPMVKLVYRRCHSDSHHHHVLVPPCRRGTEVELPTWNGGPRRWRRTSATAM